MSTCSDCMTLKRGTALHREWKLWKAHSFSEEWLESRPLHIQDFLEEMRAACHSGGAVE